MAVTKQKSESVSQRDAASTDERVRRTRARIDAAFVDLLHRRAYGRIRVSDITKKAHVGRPTFYAHYSGKDTLLKSQFERVVAPMLRLTTDGGVDATALFEHVGTASHFYRALTGAEAGSAPRVLRECFAERAGTLVATRDGSALESSVVAPFIAATLLTTVETWLGSGAKESAQEVQAVFAKLITRGVRE